MPTASKNLQPSPGVLPGRENQEDPNWRPPVWSSEDRGSLRLPGTDIEFRGTPPVG